MTKRIGIHMIIGFILVWTPLFGIIHELGHVAVGLALGSEFGFITWTTSLMHPPRPLEIMAGPTLEILFIYALGHKWVGLDAPYILFFPAVMHGGSDWDLMNRFRVNGELLFLVFSAIMLYLSVRRLRNGRSRRPKRHTRRN